ncbi:MAG: glutamyl-tRNA reductase [Actinomycetota bacterium]
MILALSAGRTSPLDLRARLALDEAGRRAMLHAPRPGVGELTILCTCHRTEVYFTADGMEGDAVHVVAGLLPGLQPTDHHDLRFMEGSEAIEHLFRVASGLDSLVVGEPQVMGQVRRAYTAARREGAAGPVLSNIFGRALRIGRQVRAETGLGRLGYSIGSIAADHLTNRLGDLHGMTAAVVGAGEAAADAATSLRKAGAEVHVTSRAPASTAKLARLIDATPHPLDDLARVLDRADFAVVAVAGGILVREAALPVRSAGHPYLVYDLSMPRAVDVGGRTGVQVLHLEELPAPNNPEIIEAVIDAESLVRKEVALLEHWLDSRASGPAIRELRSKAETLVRQEVDRGLAGLGLTPEERERMAYVGMRIANKLLHGPTAALRDADESTRTMVKRLFGLEP